MVKDRDKRSLKPRQWSVRGRSSPRGVRNGTGGWSVATRAAARIDALLLGQAVGERLGAAELADRARWAEAPAFVPATDVIEGRLVALHRAALLTASNGPEVRLAITARGRRRLGSLRATLDPRLPSPALSGHRPTD
jgi:hypothetical protein